MNRASLNWLMVVLIVIISIVLISCDDDSQPASSTPPPPPPPSRPIFDITPYYEVYDSGYHKIWSDSSWVRYVGVETRNSVNYVVIRNNSNTKYYYTPQGYAGFAATNGDVIIFDHAIPGLPSKMAFDSSYRRSTTFFYSGYSFSLTFTNRLTDTNISVSLPFGVVTPCVSLITTGTVSSGGDSESNTTNNAIGKIIGGVRSTDLSDITIIFVRGRVGGQMWGGGPDITPGHAPKPFTISSNISIGEILGGLRL
jgi:hypothetical protein